MVYWGQMKTEPGNYVINISTFNTVSQALGFLKKKRTLFCQEIKFQIHKQIIYTACTQT